MEDFHYRMLSMITNCRFHGCDTVNRPTDVTSSYKGNNGKMPGTKVLKQNKNNTGNNLDNRKYDKSPSDKIPLRQNPLQISIQTESPWTQCPPDEIPSQNNCFKNIFGQNPLEKNSPQT